MKKLTLFLIFLLGIISAGIVVADPLFEQMQQASQADKVVFQPVTVQKEIIRETVVQDGSSLLSVLVPAVVVLAVLVFGYIEYTRIKHEKKLEEDRHRLGQLVLRNYIYSSTSRGYSKQQISNALRKEGWSDNIIEEAFSGLGRK